MSAFRGDYLGFIYNGVHSSEFGIVRTSNGSRFDENLLPTMQDKTVQVPGADGTYYFGSQYTQKPISVSFAFDGLTEKQLEDLRRHFGDKKIHDLIFDERPYKVYSAKVTGTATLKYIPFAEGETKRVYKGEGSVQFTCYYPFAQCRFMGATRESLVDLYPNIDEWWAASRIEDGGNFGDIEVPFTKELSGAGSIVYAGDTIISYNLPDGVVATLDTKTGLVTDTDGKIYNEYIDGDVFFKIPVGALDSDVEGLTFTCLYY